MYEWFVHLLLLGVICSGLKGEELDHQPRESSLDLATVNACDPASHTVLHEARRSSGFSSIHLDSTELLDDFALPEGWYRFTDTPGTRMSTECVPMGMCGTRYTVWMSGNLPAPDSSATVHGCINKDGEGCCNQRTQMIVRNCGDFYIYHLSSFPQCARPVAYCTESGPWQMVFKAVKGVPKPDPYDLWVGNDSMNGNIPEASMVGIGYRGHFKSALVKEWRSLNIAKVRLSLYEEGMEVLRVIFDGTDSDKLSWFSADRIVSSPYDDLNSMDSDLRNIRIEHKNHRFMMSRSAIDCVNANGWMVMISSAGECDWDMNGPFPAFKYSRTGTATIWDNDRVGDADELAIFLRTEDTPPVCSENSYQVISNYERGVNVPRSTDMGVLDDSTLTPGWYRFRSRAGEEVSRYCQEIGSCGTRYPIWLMDVPNTESGETVTGTMCINTDQPGCCNVKIEVLICNCGGFYIYSLPKIETPFAAYCTGFDEWDLVMKGVSVPDLDPGNLYELWASDSSLNADVREAKLMDVSFPAHYKSSIVSNWNRMFVQQVRLSLYKEGTEVRRFIFDGRGSDRFNWFSEDRIVETPYKDMTATSNYTKFTLGRRDSKQFFINHVDSDYTNFCSMSEGWLVVTPSRLDCLSKTEASPSFMYSGQETSVRWAEGPVGTADVLAIFVKSPCKFYKRCAHLTTNLHASSLTDRKAAKQTDNLKVLSNPCNEKNHVVLTDTRRSKDIVHFSGWSVDDRDNRPGWYHFTDAKGANLNMPTSCVEVNQCGTRYPIWINDELPAKPGDRKPLIGCINTDEDGCCNRKIYLGALNCGDYIVYGLDQVPSIEGDDEPAGYCTESDRWHLIYKLVDGHLVDPSLEQLWRKEASVNADIALARQLDTVYPGNYKTDHVRRWSELPIEKVKVVIYKDGAEKVILIFDGENTNSLNWYSKEKLLFSPWTDLNDSDELNIFSIEGQYTPPLFGTRRWMINKDGSPCDSTSEGWFMIVANTGFLCALHKPPQILFSNTTSAENWASGSIDTGDFMAIFISLKTTAQQAGSCCPCK